MSDQIQTQVFINQLQQDKFGEHASVAYTDSYASQLAKNAAEATAEAAKEQAISAASIANEAVAMANENAEIAQDNANLAMEAIETLKITRGKMEALEKVLVKAHDKIQYLVQQMASSNDERVRQAEQRAEDIEEYYKNLLSKPLAEIADENMDFKATYETQQQILRDWILSQPGCKDLADGKLRAREIAKQIFS